MSFDGGSMRSLVPAGILLVTVSSIVFSQNFEEALQTKLNSLQVENSINGISAAVLIDSNLAWQGTAGYSNPLTGDTLTSDMNSAIASITKMFAASIILQLVEEQEISLDQSIDNWFEPSGKLPGSVTVKQLLNHTSGIADYTTTEWVDSFRVNPYRFWTIEDVMDVFVNEPYFNPGESWRYSNTNYLLLQQIVEQLEGKLFYEVLNERIFEPHNLSSMYAPPYQEPTSETVVPWFDIDLDGIEDNLFNYSMNGVHTSAQGAGYIHSNATDLAMFGHKLFAGEIVSNSSLTEMMNTTEAGFNMEYGLGIMKFLNKYPFDLYGHNGGYIGYSSILVVDPYSKITVAALTNSTERPVNALGSQLAEVALSFVTTAVSREDHIPAEFSLKQNYPNPFNPITTINYSIPEKSNVVIKVFDMLGREVTELVNGQKRAGNYEIEFDAVRLSSGIYLYTLETEQYSKTRKMMLIK